MKMYWIATGAIALSSFAGAQVRNLDAPVLHDSQSSLTPFLVAKNAQPPALPSVAQQSSALLVNGADDCSTADVITGTGAFTFDNTVATTGLNGQNNSPACTSFNLTAIAKDVWFDWTAPSAGTFQFSTCGQTTVDTKVAIYDLAAIGGTCPANGLGVATVGCNDDLSVGNVQSRILFAATAGSHFLIQLGSFPGGTPPGGTGSFSIELVPVPDAMPCQTDDGTSDLVTGFGIAGNSEQAVLQRFGNPGDNTQLSNILVSYGGLFAGAAQTSIADGMAVKVFVYDDPNDDFNPTDGVLLQQINTTIQNSNTDLFNTVPLSPPVVVSGVYFIGWSIVYPATVPATWRPFGSDIENCESLLGDQWVCWNSAAPMNFNTLGANSQVPAVYAPNLQAFVGAPPVLTRNLAWMIRPDCSAVSAGSAFCFGDGTFTDHTTACPCGNFGAPGNGCAHSFSAAGANMTASGSTVMDDVVLHASGEPVSSFTLMMQHAGMGDTLFHDGVLCASNPLIRLRGRAAVAGEAFFPNSNFAQDSTTTLSIRGGVVPGSGDVRFYAGWYRNASTTFCPPATANVTNGWQITW